MGWARSWDSEFELGPGWRTIVVCLLGCNYSLVKILMRVL